MMNITQRIKIEIDRAINNVRQAFRGNLNTSKSDGGIQNHQVSGLEGETIADVEIYQQFGFTSNPPPGTQVIALPINGKTSHSVIIATENSAFRVKALKSGEVAIYNQSGASITLKDNKIIDIECDDLTIKTKRYSLNAKETIKQISGAETMVEASEVIQSANQITLNTPMTLINGSLSAGGGPTRSSFKATFHMPIYFNQAYASQDVEVAGISFIAHQHIDSIGGETDPPKQS